MKNAYNSILVLTVVGLLVLAAGALYFGAPLFGWIIMAAIFAVFIVEQFSAIKTAKLIYNECKILDTVPTREYGDESVVGKRLTLAQQLLGKGIRLDSPMAYEVLSNSATINVPKAASGTVILLGLMGTFFGLMYSVATAGGAIDNSTTQGTLDTIQMLFQGMKGIFGTSLCGLFAALVLNASRSILLSERDSFVAKLDLATLNLQGESAGENEKSKDELTRLFDSVEANLRKVSDSVQASLNAVVGEIGEKLSTTLADMKNSVGTLGDSISGGIGQALNPMRDDMVALSNSVSAIPSKLDEKLNALSQSMDKGLEGVASSVKAGLDGVAGATGEIANLTGKSMDEASKNIAASVAEQVKQSNDQWKNFMDKLASETSANVDSQKEGLETLKNVALQVAEKAQAGSAELSQSVSEKLSTLSTDILSAFQKLSDTSAVLLDAQKALTESIDNRVVKEKEATDALGGNIVETAELMRVNQSELSANLEMLRSALETILEKLSGDTSEHEDEENFVERLNQSLEAFHERASEVLLENAVKTQEILLEVLEQTQRAAVAQQSAPKAEG